MSHFWRIAQQAERRSLKPEVAGSLPASPAKFYQHRLVVSRDPLKFASSVRFGVLVPILRRSYSDSTLDCQSGNAGLIPTPRSNFSPVNGLSADPSYKAGILKSQ